MHRRSAIGALVVALGGVVVFALMLSNRERSGRDTRLAQIERTRSLAGTVARHHRAPGVQIISNAIGSDPVFYLLKKAEEQEKAAYNAGDLVTLCIWKPGVHTPAGIPALMAIMAKCRTNSQPHHPVAWSATPDTLIGQVRPEEVRFWQNEFCEITNPVVWSETDLFQRYSERYECRLSDGTQVTPIQLAEWLNSSASQGWAVCLSFICGKDKDTRLLIGSRKSTRPEAQTGAAPNAAPPHR